MFGVLLLPPELRVAVIGLIVLTKLNFFLKCVLLGFRMLPAMDMIMCTGRTFLLFWNKVCWSGHHGVKDY